MKAIPLVVTLCGCWSVTLDGGTAGDVPIAVDVAAKCAAAHGSSEVPATAAAFTNALAGRWLVCGHDQSSPSLLLAHDGFDFTTDGKWFGLKPDTFGGYEHTVNSGTSGTYSIHLDGAAEPVSPMDTTPSASIMLRLNEPALDLAVDFEVGPPRMHTHGGSDVWLVRLDAVPDEPKPYMSKEGERCDATTACRSPLVCEQAALAGGGSLGVCALHP
jgi:hypothetical protein